ncbi:MAG: maleylpyruvate isomerase family mycothiol-dependent enzyme [Propionibacteriales bacterium]|nr:maleylpyruvate isomerase family mycothiol-dependent enzyme [Propionibacteriales bacterium]
MTYAPSLADLIETWRSAVAEFVALVRDVPEDQWALPTDLDGWSVKDNAAHTAHLEGVLAGTPEETIQVDETAPHLKNFFNVYTEQGVVARRDRSMGELADEIEHAAATRYAELQADPPTDGDAAPPRTPGGVPWDNKTLLSNRPVDVWMHEQDIRRAIGRPGGYDSPGARHTITKFGGALPMVLGKRVAPPAGTVVRLDVPEADASWTVAIGEDGRAAATEQASSPTVLIELSAEDFVVLAGGRRGLEATTPTFTGDEVLGRTVLSHFGITP